MGYDVVISDYVHTVLFSQAFSYVWNPLVIVEHHKTHEKTIKCAHSLNIFWFIDSMYFRDNIVHSGWPSVNRHLIDFFLISLNNTILYSADFDLLVSSSKQ